MPDIRIAVAGVAIAVSLVHASVASATPIGLAELIGAAVRLPCSAAPGTGLAPLADTLPLARSIRNGVSFSLAGIVERRMTFSVGGDQLLIRFRGPTGAPRHVSARYDVDQRPSMLAVADASCTIHTARRLHYDEAGRPERLEILDHALRPTGEAQLLNPEVPEGDDPTGIVVGLVDTGVNYLLPEIASRLARDSGGRILGYDFWDLDRRPYDVSLTDPFFPGHHGTETASILLAEAPVAKLIPYRYPRNDMTRMAAPVTASG